MTHDELLQIRDKWSKRSDKDNSKFNLERLSEQVVSSENIKLNTGPWIFSHIPKTAGTSLESYLSQAFALKDQLHVNAPDLNRLPQVLALKNNFPQLIMGHHPMHGLLYQLLPEQKIVHLSMMREPISRVVSYYNYLATRKYHALHAQVELLSFDQFIVQKDLVEINNGQAKRIAGLLHSTQEVDDNELYFQAKYAVDHCFSVIGVTELFKQFHQLIAQTCGVIFHQLPPINRSKIKVQLTDLSASQRLIIEANNKVDIQLYQYVKSLFLEKANP